MPRYVASSADPIEPLLYNPDAWYKVYTGEWARWGNSAEVEQAILRSSIRSFPYSGNVFSSTSTTLWIPPLLGSAASPHEPPFFNFATSMLPAPGLDGHRAVVQPDGRVVETYATIVLSSGQVVALSYSITNPSGDDWQNGQTASMAPIYAGQLYDDEITVGVNHAIAITVPASLLAAQIVSPAHAFDRDAAQSKPPYSGAIPMGGRLALPQSIYIASLNLQTPEGLVIAAAAQRYGFIIMDRGGDGITLRVQPNASVRDPALHSWNSPLQADLNSIFAKVEEVQFQIATTPP
jgi:hypothetical protein